MSGHILTVSYPWVPGSGPEDLADLFCTAITDATLALELEKVDVLYGMTPDGEWGGVAWLYGVYDRESIERHTYDSIVTALGLNGKPGDTITENVEQHGVKSVFVRVQLCIPAKALVVGAVRAAFDGVVLADNEELHDYSARGRRPLTEAEQICVALVAERSIDDYGWYRPSMIQDAIELRSVAELLAT